MAADPTGKQRQANRQLEHHHQYLGLQDLGHQRAAPLTRLRRHAALKIKTTATPSLSPRSAADAAATTTAASAQHEPPNRAVESLETAGQVGRPPVPAVTGHTTRCLQMRRQLAR